MVIRILIAFSLGSLMSLLGIILQIYHIIEHPAMWSIYGVFWGMLMQAMMNDGN